MKKIIFVSILAAGIYSIAGAQIFYTNHPPRIKWNRIETNHLEIIYPQGLDSVAQRTANLMNFVYTPVTKSLQTDPRKISFFLFNQSAISNGYVTPIGPMMAWYTTPTQDVPSLGSEDWFQTLAVHEYRHATQFEKMDKGTTRVAHILFGDNGAAVLGAMSHPFWFAEGDAVATETALTNAGRGRLPSFAAPLRAAVLEGKPYGYDRVYLGSYNYRYPNYYTLGYYLQVYGRRQKGELFWSEVLDGVSPRSFSPYRFSRVLKKKTGMRVSAYHKAAMEDIKTIWMQQEQGRRYAEYTPLSSMSKNGYTSYTNPIQLPYSTMFAVKSGADYPSQFVLIKNGKEEKLFNRAPAGGVTASGNVLCWSEFISDKRYLERSFSDIYLYNIESKKLRRLTHRAKYFAPAISPDGTQIAAVEFTDMMQCSLQILDAERGNVIQTHTAAPGEFFRAPTWEPNGESLVMQVSKGEENVFVRYTLSSGARDTLYGPTKLAINTPSVEGHYLLFNSPATGLDAVHAFDLSTHKEYVAVQSRFGAQNGSVMQDGKSICYENYSSDGFSIVQSPYNPASWQPLESAVKTSEDYFRPLVAQEQGASIFDSKQPDSTFAVSRYWPFTHLISVHSWAFIPLSERVSLNLYSNDKLNQLSAVAGVTYNDVEDAVSEHISLSYMKYFPVISAEAVHGFRTGTVSYEDRNGDSQSTYYHWQEKSASLGIELPFNFSRGHYTRAISLKWSALYKYVYDMDLREHTNGIPDTNGVIIPLKFTGIFINYQTKAERNLQPNWGQTLQIQSEYALAGLSDFGTKQISVVAKQYLPGLMPSHGLYVQAGYEWQQNMNWQYRAPSYMRFTRGYAQYSYDHWAMARAGYLFPVVYPDAHLGGTVYFKRLYAELFADYSRALDNGAKTTNFTSVGTELTLDFIPFRWIFLPMNIGIRISATVETNEFASEFMFMKMSF